MKQTLVFSSLLLAFGPALADCYYDTIRSSTWQTRFVNNGDGTVTDKATGLQWKRCAEGQIFSGNSCTGVASNFSWKNALHHADQASFGGYDDWRLPNIKELYSIVEVACKNPAINTIIFQETPSKVFWSSAAFEVFWRSMSESEYYIWSVDFKDGSVKNSEISHSGRSMRLVRSVEQ